MARIREELPQSLRQYSSNIVCELALHELNTWRERKKAPLAILGYLPFRSELDIRPVLEECRKSGDTVLAPRIHSGTRHMRLLIMNQATDEEVGTWGIPEPNAQLQEWEEDKLAEIDVVLVPGLAFDTRGGRIGYGGGFYDRLAQRFAAAHANPSYWALAFAEQVIQEVPMQPHDFRLEQLIDPTGVTFTKDRI
ncbi:5-formyltetrahydrofolate cyclo-ligase [Saccharibacillus sp. JS10]|nr:5-formyltetrahydrofolate cyclo-ligase [Saccharibacillus sp. JS10]